MDKQQIIANLRQIQNLVLSLIADELEYQNPSNFNSNQPKFEPLEPSFNTVSSFELDSQDPLAELLDYDLIKYLDNQDNKVEKPVHFNLSQAIIDDLFDKS